eukprot:ctg_4676.g498
MYTTRRPSLRTGRRGRRGGPTPGGDHFHPGAVCRLGGRGIGVAGRRRRRGTDARARCPPAGAAHGAGTDVHQNRAMAGGASRSGRPGDHARTAATARCGAAVPHRGRHAHDRAAAGMPAVASIRGHIRRAAGGR